MDGNGRVGRLLIALLLHAEGALQQPLLYLSLYFKQHREVYYDLLQGVRLHGDWEAWLAFFFQGIAETATGAVDSAHRLLAVFAEDRARIQGLGRPAGSILQVHHALQSRPLSSVSALAPQTKLAQATVYKALNHLVTLGIAKEITGSQRNRLFAYDRVLRLLSEGTEPLGRGRWFPCHGKPLHGGKLTPRPAPRRGAGSAGTRPSGGPPGR